MAPLLFFTASESFFFPDHNKKHSFLITLSSIHSKVTQPQWDAVQPIQIATEIMSSKQTWRDLWSTIPFISVAQQIQKHENCSLVLDQSLSELLYSPHYYIKISLNFSLNSSESDSQPWTTNPDYCLLFQPNPRSLLWFITV